MWTLQHFSWHMIVTLFIHLNNGSNYFRGSSFLVHHKELTWCFVRKWGIASILPVMDVGLKFLKLVICCAIFPFTPTPTLDFNAKS